MNLNEFLTRKMQGGRYSSISKLIFLAYSLTMILIIPSFESERVLIGSFFIDLLIRAFIILSLFQSISFILNFESSISRFYGGKVSIKISDLDPAKKIMLAVFSILSGLSTYLILNYLISFFVPDFGQFSKVFASIFGLYISMPLLLKVIGKEK